MEKMAMDLTARLQRQLSSPKGRLTWFFNFLNMDFGSLPPLDLIALDYGLHAMRDELDLSRAGEPEEVFADSPGRRLEIKMIQDRLRRVLEGVIACKPKIDHGSKDETSLQRARRLSRRLKVEICQMDMFLYIKGDNLIFEPSQEIDQIFFQFINDLSQFPVEATRICERSDCQKFFLKGTQKEKRYCSNKCAWVMNARAKRAEDPEKERAKKRKTYERRVHKNLPGAKVTRKPRSILTQTPDSDK
jgi:hypothetical protein